MNRSLTMLSLLACALPFAEDYFGSTGCYVETETNGAGTSGATPARAKRRSPAEMEAARAAGTAPAPKTKASAATDNVKRTVLARFFDTAGFTPVGDGIERAVASETEAIFTDKNKILQARGDVAGRLRTLSRSDAETTIAKEILGQLNTDGGPDLDPFAVFASNGREAVCWAAAKVLITHRLDAAFETAASGK